MQPYAYVILAVGWLVWIVPFVRARLKAERASQLDRRARWGLPLVGIAFALVWHGPFWERPVQGWRLAGAVCLLASAGVLSWTSTRALGRHWRVDAGLNAEHQLVTWGPYRLVRHPIYTSMLCMLCGTGLLIAKWPLLLAALPLFFMGTEIRVRTEERLLVSRFGEHFREYQRSVPAYIPFLR
jgi:protein-S-isoprenylcysteine O-methyltransferase Ste14